MDAHRAEELATGEPVTVIDVIERDRFVRIVGVDRLGAYRLFAIDDVRCTEPGYLGKAPESEPWHEHEWATKGTPELEGNRMIGTRHACEVAGCDQAIIRAAAAPRA